MICSKNKTLLLTMLLCTVSPLSFADSQPGDACTAPETGYLRQAANIIAGPTVTGQNFMVCDGSNWISFISYNEPTDSVLFRAPAAAPIDATFGNSQWTIWLDEVNDEFELKGKKSNGTIISSTVGGGGGGSSVWTDNTTYITANNAHIIDVGQSLPAALDDNGTRMFFYPDKGAFRGGRIVSGNNAWQDANIGTDSFAWGANVAAGGIGSVAMGHGTTAGGTFSVAMGGNNTSSGSSSFTMGTNNTASGEYSIAMGGNNTSSAYYSVAMGGSNTSSGLTSVAMGYSNTASGSRSVAMMNDVTAEGNSSAAFGLQTASQATDPKVSGARSMALFFDGGTANANSGFDLTASDRLALVGGMLQIGETEAAGAAAGCVQFNNTSNELEFSDDCSTFTSFASLSGGGGGGSSVWTDNTAYITANNAHIIDVGQSLPAALDDNGTRMFFYPDKAAFRGGTIVGGNDAWQDGKIGTGSFAWGANVAAGGISSVAMGSGTTAGGTFSVAMGVNNTSSGSSSFTMGTNNTASGEYSIAMGGNNTSSAYYSVAMGSSNTASGSRSVAMGQSNTASGSRSVAMMNDVTAEGNSSAAFGLQTAFHSTVPKVSGDRSIAFFFDGGVGNENSGVNVTANDVFVVHGGRVGINNLAPSVELDVTGDIEYSGTLADVSDRRLKENINALPEGQLDKVLKLEGISFTMKNDPNAKQEFGFIAQDVRDIYPSLIYEQSDGMLSMNYVGLIAPMAEAMAEQNALIKTQQEMIEKLSARLDALEAEKNTKH